MEEDVVFKHKKIKLKKKEWDNLLRELETARAESYLRRQEEPKIIRKTDLKNHRFLLIEHRNRFDVWRPVWVGLMKTRVNKEEKTMTGIRIFICCGGEEFREYTYNMNMYRKNWRAWTGMPKTDRAWK